MNWQGWFTLALLAVMLAGLARYTHLTDVIFLGGVTLLGLVGIITPAEALSGFSNAGMVTVAALFVVATGLRDTGVLDRVARRVLGRPTTERRALVRLIAPITALSAVLNNTTVVAMALPVVLDWCRKHRLSPSRFLIPLSYATIAGGVCTLIGTSTNLIVHGLMLNAGMKGFGFLEIGFVGAPIALASLLFLVWYAPRALPHRAEFLEQLDAARREYTVEMEVESACPLLGQSVQAAGLRQLPGLFLVEINRGAQLIAPVAPDEKLEAGDRLVFVGVVSTIVDLQKIKGLRPASSDTASGQPIDPRGRHLCEAVISTSSPLVGRGIRESNFRTVYDAAIVAVHRNGARLAGKIGDIMLRPGDTLLLQTATGFLRAHRNNPDFYLISEVGGSEPVRHEKAWLAACIMLVLVLAMTIPDILEWTGAAPSLYARLDRGRVLMAIAAAGLMVVSRCVPSAAARRSIQWDVIFVIAASFGIGTAMEKTGAAAWIVSWLMPLLSSTGVWGAVAVIYFITMVLTELLTNNAAAALMFPLAMATSRQLNLDPHTMAITIAVAASGGFATPIGYQTHMMVFGPGGYRFSDFIKAGLLMDLLWFILAVALIPLIWPLPR